MDTWNPSLGAPTADGTQAPSPSGLGDPLRPAASSARISVLVSDTQTEPCYSADVAARKSGHGGPRPGSGRKPILKDRKSIKVSLDGSTYDRLAEAAERRDTSIGALVREAVEAHLSKRGRRKR